MKRFYCTECKRERRVRNLPLLSGVPLVISDDGEEIPNPNITQREGICPLCVRSITRHTDPKYRTLARAFAKAEA